MKIKPLFNNPHDITLRSYLEKCGISDIDEYIKPTGKYIENPYSYINMREGVQAFKYHYLQNDDTYILCDSGDTDGITSTTIIYRYMKLMNPKWNVEILIHKGKQRGLDDEELFAKCLNKPRPLLIIPDSGTNDKLQVEQLSNNGTTVLCLDHHNLTTPIEQGILINCQMGNVDKHGSGAMVTHHFCRALDIEFGKKYSGRFVDLASLSIMSDGCDIRSMQNRTYLHYGIMGGLGRIKNKFLRLMMTELIKDDYIQKDINFTLVPKINAICRGDNQKLKQNMICAFIGIWDNNDDKLLDTLSQMKSAHTNQQNAVKKFIKDNFESIDKSNDIIVHISDQVPRTYSGLVAGRVKEMCDNKPTIMSYDYKSSDISIGSLRSDIPLQKILNDCEYVDWCKGHDGQAGIQFKKSNIDNIIRYINTLKLDYKADKDVLAILKHNSIPNELYGLYEPYRRLFDTNYLKMPCYYIKPFTIKSSDISLKGGVLRLKKDGITFVRFFSGNDIKERLYMNEDCTIKIEMIVELEINRWQDKIGRIHTNEQCVIQDFECHKVDDEEIKWEDIW